MFQTLTAKSGIIKTPNYPENYNANSDCYWEFIRPEDGSCVVFTVEDFNIDTDEPVGQFLLCKLSGKSLQYFHFQYGFETNFYPLDQNRFSDILKNHVQRRIIDNFPRIMKQNHKITPTFVIPGLRLLGASKTGFNLIFFHFNICRKLSIIRCYSFDHHSNNLIKVNSMSAKERELFSQIFENMNKFYQCIFLVFRLKLVVKKFGQKFGTNQSKKIIKLWVPV